MNTLKDKVIKTIDNILHCEAPPLHKEIYYHKVLLAPQRESIFFSFRFHNAKKDYFLLSLMVQLKDTKPVVQCNICLLDSTRKFIRSLLSIEEKIPLARQLPALMIDPATNNFYKLNRRLPNGLLLAEYENSVEKKLTEYLSTIEEGVFTW